MADRHIYVVDDDDDVRASLECLLSGLPDTCVRSFPSGDEFLRHAPDLPCGIVLLDYYMPGRNGLEVLEALQAHGTHFVPVMVTAHDDVNVAVRAMQAGAADFLEKPYDHKDLMAILDVSFAQLT